MSWLLSFCCGRPPKDCKVARPREEGLRAVLDSIRLTSCNLWHLSASNATDVLREALGPSSHVSIFGASPCGGSLVLLGCSGPVGCPALLPVGHVMPSPWSAKMLSSKEPKQPIMWTGSPRNFTLLAPGMSSASCESWTGLRSRLQHVMLGISKTASLHSQSQSQSQLHSRLHSAVQPSPSVDILLVPLELGSQLVGALLWAQPPHAAAAAAPAAAAAETVATEWHVRAHLHVAVDTGGDKTPVVGAIIGGGHRDDDSGGVDIKHSEPAKLIFSQTAARTVAGVLVDCMVVPHLRSLQQICAAAHLLAHSSDVSSLASVLSTAVSEALRSELHVELQVRVAMATVAATTSATDAAAGGVAGTAAPLHYGFMLQMRPPSTLTQAQIPATTWQLQTADLQPTPAASAAAPSAALLPPTVPMVPRGPAVAANDGRGSRGSQTRPVKPLQQPGGGGGGGGGFDVASRSEVLPDILQTNPHSRTRSFIFVTTVDTVRMESGLAAADDGSTVSGRPGVGGVTGGAAGAAATAVRLLSESNLDRRAWKAVPFLLTSSLMGELLREDGPERSCASAIPTSSSGAAGCPHGYGNGQGTCATNSKISSLGSPLVAVAAMVTASAVTAGSPLEAAVSPLPPSPVGANGLIRLTGIVVQDLHSYLQEVDQPGGDVLLLFSNGRRGGGGGGGSGASAGAAAPACLVLLVSTGAAGASGGGALRQGVSGDLGPLRPTPEDAYGNFDGGDAATSSSFVRPTLALFITSQERLPSSLLRAARDAGQKIMEMLLPASLESLTWGPAAGELAEMSLLMESRTWLGSSVGMTAVGRRDSGPCCVPSPPASAHRHVMLPRTLSNVSCVTVTSALTSPLDGIGAAASLGPAATSDVSNGHVTGPATATAAPFQLPCNAPGRSPPRQLQQPAAMAVAAITAVSPQSRKPLRKFSSRSSMLSRTRALASTGDGRDGFVPDSPQSSSGAGGGRRVPAEFAATMLSPCTSQSASPSASVTASLSTTNRQASLTTNGIGTDVGGCSSPSSLPHVLRARLEGTASVGGPPVLPHPPRRSVTDLLDLDGVGAVVRVPELPPMDVLLASFQSTLNEAESDTSPYPSDDLRFLRLTKIIGDGGCSVVYAGRLLGLEVAVKVLNPLAEAAPEEPPASPHQPQQQTGRDAACLSGPQQQPDEGGGSCSHQSQAQEAHQAALWAAARQTRLKDLMRGVRELAVLSSISHPNIVQVYSYHTNVTFVPGAGPNDLPKLVLVSTKQQQQQIDTGPPRVAIIMECCDIGSLADALDSGRFKDAIIQAATAARPGGPPAGIRRANSNLDHKRVLMADTASACGGVDRQRGGSVTAQSGGGGVAMRAIYLTLLEVALALRHLHSRHLAHCDVKAANVLLKSSLSDPRGFTCKLGDFGLVSIVRRDTGTEILMPAPGQDGAVGTITHLAPEYFSAGTRLDFSVDIYAFGIVMWEVFTSKPPYVEHAATNFKDLPRKVVREGLRPRWPHHVPPAYRNLACTCWASIPSERPNAAAVVSSLQRLMES
ncbi:hypothetical protein VaNZ11_001170 [Volvox africanus]|uniref:Protein kinase domain-containing protein n=1 Tax=Volvox africanus TaxID=51714 RepID=A0ABQ5RQE8_9CHLO|nr:hypothetical protein VaNZ11_001170 [Volvox africanus]